jgi:hypothetical protein
MTASYSFVPLPIGHADITLALKKSKSPEFCKQIRDDRTFSASIDSSPKCKNRTEAGSYLHTRRAVSHTLSSLRLCSSMERPLPRIEGAKPH